MGQSNVLLRIYYVKDFPPHTLLLEIRKGYFMEPETNLPRGKKKNDFEKEGEEKKTMELCSIKSSTNNKGKISRGLGGSLKMLVAPPTPLFRSFAMFQIHASSFFRKCVVLMHFKSPFSKHNGISP